jgi:hypothetical protein
MLGISKRKNNALKGEIMRNLETDAIISTYRELELIDKMASAFAKHIKPEIPLHIELWDIATIASYLKRNEHVVRERIACKPDFPAAIRLPSEKGRRGHPLYKAKEVILWAEKYMEKK